MFNYPGRYFISLLLSFIFINWVFATGPGSLDEEAISNVQKAAIETEEQQKQLQVTAGLLAEYEISAIKLIDSLEEGADSQALSNKALELLDLSESVIDSARFRLPQCDAYLSKTLELKSQLNSIPHETLESDYHLDGALPTAGGECYHTKDLFVHPATVIVLTRDDPTLTAETKESIKAEISEVLAHTEIVRQLVIY